MIIKHVTAYPFNEKFIKDIAIHGENKIYTITANEIEALLIESGDMCAECLDTGEVATDEDDGEGHLMQGVGTRKCICQLK